MIESVPAGSVSVANVAMLLLTVPVPIALVPFLKVTVPVTLPPHCGVIVAVQVTFCQ